MKERNGVGRLLFPLAVKSAKTNTDCQSAAGQLKSISSASFIQFSLHYYFILHRDDDDDVE
jgi:hypothetical protein